MKRRFSRCKTFNECEKNLTYSYFNLMIHLFQEDCKQPEGYKVSLLNIHMIQDKTIQQTYDELKKKIFHKIKSLLCPIVNLNSFKNELNTYLVEPFLHGSDIYLWMITLPTGKNNSS
jgi:hypothetical protein